MEREAVDSVSHIRGTVLIISSASDAHIPFVMEKLEDLGVRVFRFNTEILGVCGNVTMCLEYPLQSNKGGKIQLVTNQQEVSLDEITAVWYRRPKSPNLSEFQLSPEGLAFAHDEWRATLNGLYSLLDNALWVSRPDRIQIGENKLLQLHTARELGFTIPRTLVTNDKEAVLEFWHHLDGAIVTKPIGLGWVYVQNASGKELVRSVMTNEVDDAALEDLNNLQVAPAIFQEAVPKAYELRINVVGHEVFTTRIDSQESEISRVDWRRYDLEHTPHSIYQLPENIEGLCKQLVAKLGLQFGAIDMIRRPDGEYVFLEINCNGQFAWLEELTGLPISEALARLLVGLAPALVCCPPNSMKGGEKR
jgi:glutathione synthase/RimK-type ligase-like ATP-grasp enzyme